MTMATFPSIHLNGSSVESLCEQTRAAVRAVSKALDALCEAAPNGRDYYPQGDSAFESARSEHQGRLQRLEDVKMELMEQLEHLQGKE
jgi:hypothetical protein